MARRSDSPSEVWRKMVLRSMPPPAWLRPGAPDDEIVISSRIRYARNIAGHPFPHHADQAQRQSVIQAALEAAATLSPALEVKKNLTEAERDFMLGSRLISADFDHRSRTTAVLLDRDRQLSLMVNEEDHLRVQALTPGQSWHEAENLANQVLSQLESKLRFMHHDGWGYLTASPFNAGAGRRRSALIHLIGLAHTRQLTQVLKAIHLRGLEARGLYGESSRAVGAFFQLSATQGTAAEFDGACRFLIERERAARESLSAAELRQKVRQAAEFAIRSVELSLADSLRILGWARWYAAATPGYEGRHREIDDWTSKMEVHGTQDPKVEARHRADFLRPRIESLSLLGETRD